MPCYDETIMELLKRSLTWKYYGGSHFQLVRHPDSGWRLLPFMVIVCPTEGLYYSRINGAGQITIRPGEALIAPKGLKHTVAMPDGGVLHHAHIQYDLFGSTDVMKFFKVPFLVKDEIGALIADVIRDLHIAMNTEVEPGQALKQTIKRISLSSRLLELLIGTAELRGTDWKQLNEILRIEPALRYMEAYLSGNICRHDLAKLSSLSETRFHFVFKSAIGISPMTYLKNLRMNKAQILLFQSELSIAEVGERVGYPDVFHFSKIFKDTFLITPSKYRKETRMRLMNPTMHL